MSEGAQKTGWFARLKAGLGKSAAKIGDGIGAIFTRRKLDAAMLEALEEVLISADMGAGVAAELVAAFGANRFDKEIAPEEVKAALAEEIARILAPVARPFAVDAALKPHVVLVVGVNGNGKTTTIAKLAQLLTAQGHRVMLAAADTFRAAAVEQLAIWAARTDCRLITGEDQADPASVAYRAYEEATKDGADVLLIDTAGRLQNKSNLMAELQKITRVLQKITPEAPHSVIQVLDATTGQNALSQVEVFREMVKVTGLIVTKLDGTAKGGMVVALARAFGLPIHAVGVGEGKEDFRAFEAEEFARGLVG